MDLKVSPKTKRIGKKTYEKLISDTEALQIEIVGEIKQEKERVVIINPLINIYLPVDKEMKIQYGVDYILLRKRGKNLRILLDPQDDREISIGNSDYRITREGKLVELQPGGIFDIIPKRKSGSKDYQLVKNETGKFIIDLMVIEGNETIKKLFEE